MTGDGRDDLAVGLPRYGCDGCATGGPGAVVLLRGAADGLTGAGHQFWWHDSPGVDGVARSEGGFGASLAMGPLDADRYADVAIGSPADRVRSGGEGSVTVLRGSSSGLTTAGFGGQRYSQATPGIAGTPEEHDEFGAAVSISLVQSRRQGSLIIGVPEESVGGVNGAGQIHQLSIGRRGPDASRSRTLNPGTPGVEGDPSALGGFGRTVH